ncbi:flagellar assembly protein FliH [Virgibacillus oceani]
MYNPYISEKKTIGIKQVDKLKNYHRAEKDEVFSAKEHAERELSKAKEELRQINEEKEAQILNTKTAIYKEKENWQEEKKKLMVQAEEEGYEAGFLNGKEESLKAFSSLIEQANNIVDAALIDYNKTIEKSEETILNLAIHTASKVMKQKIEDDPFSFLPIVKAAMKELKDQRVITIYLHPDNYQTVMEQKDELVHILEDDMKLSIYAKEDLHVNGCLIHHPFGQIDASVDTQLEEIRSALFEIAMESKS